MRRVFLWPVRRGEIFPSLQLAEKALSESERKGKELREKPIRGFSRFQSEVFQSFLRSEKLAQSGEKTVSPDWGKFFPPLLQRRGKGGIIENGSWSGIEVVITALTRNQVYPQGYRGFESHPLRQLRNSPYRCASRPEGAESSAGRGIPSLSPVNRFAGFAGVFLRGVCRGASLAAELDFSAFHLWHV